MRRNHQCLLCPSTSRLLLPSTGESLNCASAKNATAEDSTYTSPEQGTAMNVSFFLTILVSKELWLDLVL